MSCSGRLPLVKSPEIITRAFIENGCQRLDIGRMSIYLNCRQGNCAQQIIQRAFNRSTLVGYFYDWYYILLLEGSTNSQPLFYRKGLTKKRDRIARSLITSGPTKSCTPESSLSETC